MNDEALVQKIGINAKGVRKARRMTLQEVADRSGLAKSYVWEIEKGVGTNPSITKLIALADALGTSLDGLIGLKKYTEPGLRPEAMRIAVEVDTLIRAALDTRDKKIERQYPKTFQEQLHSHQPLRDIRSAK